ncbi:L-lysine exporter family protein LysE/ArgO [Scopulibacillus darangshiensis]|uniref:L-lysine exporter family protein LysE/ArgO n=1 Tax=Scopulibacillus darangshiensis TaxID=442528 RepID=A0A4R2P3N5_9BACL|nr:LysE/ArgO family amino acid transporter [Scopulibacillus darangshiensis]TCP29389.1 L-lysine exporter family protein LysE/ArgO [Scopulibacillus darangshiensis]
MFEAFLHGFLLAFGLILPLGPQNVFVFNQGALQSHFRNALPVILTAAICDTILIILAVIGVSVIVLSFSWLQTIVYGIGFIFLVYMGWSIWRTVPSKDETTGKRMSAKKQVTFATSVSLLNPHAIIDTIGVIGTNSISYTGLDKFVFAMVCIAVSWIWFFGLAIAGRILGRVDTTGKWIVRLNKMSALIIWLVAIFIGKEFLSSI